MPVCRKTAIMQAAKLAVAKALVARTERDQIRSIYLSALYRQRSELEFDLTEVEDVGRVRMIDDVWLPQDDRRSNMSPPT